MSVELPKDAESELAFHVPAFQRSIARFAPRTSTPALTDIVAQLGGTSASTPIFSSIINRIDEERLAHGKTPVGFLNPALYENPWVLNDITNGSNPGCGTIGFSAVKGWDPVTGLGTPNYPKMLELFMRLP